MIFRLNMIPPTITAQEKKVTVKNCKPVFYEPPKLKDAKDKLLAHLSKHAPDKPMKGALKLQVKWCWPNGCKDWRWRDTKPDTDNLQKMLKDCMTICGFWEDDAQVVQEMIEKFWADPCGIYISLEEAERR